MSTGDTDNMTARLRAVLPPWFPDDAPITNAVLAGLGTGLAFGYSLIQFAKTQTRVATATGGWLDLTAWDFFGARFVRRPAETDDAFRPRILKELLRPRQTRAAIAQALEDLTGTAPQIIEPWNPGDCGAYGIGTLAYGMAGCYGSLSLPNQIFINAARPPGVGVPNVGGYGVGGLLGYSVAGTYVDLSQVTGPVTDADIYKTVAETIAAGVTAWVSISNALPSSPPPPSLTMDGGGVTSDSTLVTTDHA